MKMYNHYDSLYYYHPDGMEDLYAPVDSNGEFFDDYIIYYFRKDVQHESFLKLEVTKEKDFLVGFIRNQAIIFNKNGGTLFYISSENKAVRLITDYSQDNLEFC